MPEITRDDWDAWLADNPTAHLLQTGAWGELKSAFGWQVTRWVDQFPEPTYGVQILFRRLPLGFSLAYIARGPVLQNASTSLAWTRLWSELDRVCRARRAIFLRIEPDVWCEGDNPIDPPPGLLASRQSIQPPRTIIIDLASDEETTLAKMKQKTRYNIRLAEKKGIHIHSAQDLAPFFRLMSLTGGRDGFGIHSQEYYQKAYDLFSPTGNCRLFQADFEDEPVAALMVFTSGERAWYLYGASSDTHREKMPAYLLQWEAMRWAKTRGAVSYDLYGIPDLPEAELEEGFTQRSDGLWGVYRFKRGFGGQVRRAAGPWDRVYQPILYRIYQSLTTKNAASG
jgi:lipid II:glycine glycyltransferase (peptidoglycan interpeptide bridge formation enzyme)